MKSILLLAFIGQASALVAHGLPMARAAAPAVVASRAAASPVMLFGAGSAGRALRRISPSFGKMPRIGKPGMGPSDGDGGDGGDGTSDALTPEPEDKGETGLGKVWKRYEELLDAKPLLMKALTSMVGFALGDILAQLFIQKNDDFDWLRLFRLTSFGFLVHGTTSHWFYGMLDGKIPGTSAAAVFTKVFIDQVLWNPCFGVMFFSYVAAFELKGIDYVIDKIKNELLVSVTGSWKVWPLAHAINFRFIPSSQRVLYINSIQIGYNCFLSIISNRAAEAA